MSDQRDQPPLPFEPGTQLIGNDDGNAPVSADDRGAREVSVDALSALLFEEFRRRSAEVQRREQRSTRR